MTDEEVKTPSKEELLAIIENSDGEKENKESVVENNEGEEEGGEVQLTEIEQEAMSHGWKPDGAEGKRTLTAEEFMDRQPLYDEIHSLKRQTRKLQEGVSALTKHQDHVRKQEREKTIQELKQKKVEAMDAGDNALVVDLEDQIQDTKAEAKVVEEPSNDDFEEWIDNNTWYNQDSAMKSYADTMGKGYSSLHPEKPLADVYAYVTQEVKARYPDKFAGSKRGRQAPVEGASKGRKVGKQPKYSTKDLPEDARDIMKTVVRMTKGMSEQDYVNSYFGV